MNIKEISEELFNDFLNKSNIKNYFQTAEYGKINVPLGYTPMYIGAYENKKLILVCLILSKQILSKIKYGYCPRGFILDYYDKDMLDIFTSRIKSFFFKKGFAFIKINPEVIYAKINYKDNTKIINEKTKKLIDSLQRQGYKKLKDNLYFESMLPKFNAVIDLEKYNLDLIDESIKSKFNNQFSKSLFLVSAGEENIEDFFNLVREKRNRTLDYYKDFYSLFSQTKSIDLLFIKMDFNIYLKTLQDLYKDESNKNNQCNNLFFSDPSNMDYYNRKINSDKNLSGINKEITTTTALMSNNENDLVATALIVKQKGRVNIIISGYNKNFEKLNLDYYLYYKIISTYKSLGYKFLDLNAVSGNFTEDNPYKHLNEFKLSFKPDVYEYIGEFDLIVNNAYYSLLNSTNSLQKEFTKKK